MGNDNQKDGSQNEKLDWKKHFFDWKNSNFSQNVPAQLALLAILMALTYAVIHTGSDLDNKHVVVTTETTTKQPGSEKQPVVVAKHGVESTGKGSTAKDQNPGGRGADKPKQATMSPWDWLLKRIKDWYELVH